MSEIHLSTEASAPRRKWRLIAVGAALAATLAVVGLRGTVAQADPPAVGTWERPDLADHWITPFVAGGGYFTSFMKDEDGWVHLRGLLRAQEVPVHHLYNTYFPADVGPWVPNEPIFTLPEGFRPCATSVIPIMTTDSVNGVTGTPAQLWIFANGDVLIGTMMTPHPLQTGGGGEQNVSTYGAPIDGAEFLAEDECATTYDEVAPPGAELEETTTTTGE